MRAHHLIPNHAQLMQPSRQQAIGNLDVLNGSTEFLFDVHTRQSRAGAALEAPHVS